MGSTTKPAFMMRPKQMVREERIVTLFCDILRMLRKNVPIAAVWYHKGQMKIVGSKHLGNLFESLDKTELEQTMILDEESLSCGLDPLWSLFNDENTSNERALASYFLQEKLAKTELKRLPYPVSLMSRKEKIKYISDHASNELRDKHQNPHIGMHFGHPDFQPSFWLEDDWPWEECKMSLSKVKKETYKGKGTWSVFLEKTITNLIRMKQEDPETFISEEQNEKIIARKLRAMKTLDDERKHNMDEMMSESEFDEKDACTINKSDVMQTICKTEQVDYKASGDKTKEYDEEHKANITAENDPLMSEVLDSNLLQELKPLPFPLSLMSKKEKVKYICDQAVREAREKHQNPYLNFRFGNPDLRPSFWLEHDWPWERCTMSLSRVKNEMYNGKGTLAGFLENCIKHLFRVNGKDPETFISEEQNEETILRKLRTRKPFVNTSKDEVIMDENAPLKKRKKYSNEEVLGKWQYEEEYANEKELTSEEDSPMSITISSKGHKPIEVNLDRGISRKRPQS